MCKPCTIKCKCKAKCNNPHNNGGECPRCSIPESDSESEHEDETLQNEEMIPIVPSSSRDDFDSEPESDEDHNV